MDDLLLFTPLRLSHITNSEDLLKTLLRNRLKISPKNCRLFRTELQYRVIQYLYKIEEFVLNH